MNPNEAAPPLHIEGALNGAEVTLAGLRGAPALFLFFNIGCAGCTGRAIPLTLELAERFPALQIAAIHSVFPPTAKQPTEQVRAVADYFKLPYPILLDQQDRSYRAYGAEGTPHWVLLNADGTVRRSFFGSMEGSRQRLDYALAELFPEREA